MIFETINISTLVWLVLGIVLLFPVFPLSLGAFAAGLYAWLGYGIVRQLIAAFVVSLIFIILIFVVAGVMNARSLSRSSKTKLLEKSCRIGCAKENHDR
jgi:uncharacterized membrane protein